jgi:membrane protein DedA with SNARE-associated domain/rhodanese-related sulfurtransferase
MSQFSDVLAAHGVSVLFAATLAERLGLPLPAAPLLLVAGSLVATGQLGLAMVLAAAIVASIVGDAVWFVLGRRFGHRVLRLLCRLSLSADTCVRQSEGFILKWGGAALVAAKFVPGVSVVAAPVSGALAMPWGKFLGFEVLGAGVWAAAYLALGLVLAPQVETLLAALRDAGMAAGAVVLLLLALYLAWRYLRRRRALREGAVARVSVQQLHTMLHSPQPPLVLDVRSAAGVQLDPRQVPGAVHVELERVTAWAQERAREPTLLERDIVAYCSCPNDVSAVRAVALLKAQGHTRAWPLAGGLEAWAAGGAEATAS